MMEKSRIVTVEEMRAIEQKANSSGLTYEKMMEHAGKGVADVVIRRFGDLADKQVLGLVGSGNNGGDTLVALDILTRSGWKAVAYLLRPRGDNDPLLIKLRQSGGSIYYLANDPEFKFLDGILATTQLILDGVLGTGIKLPLRGTLAAALKHIREILFKMENRPIVLAVDCPSGIDCDSGEVAEETIPADLTVTMAAVKQGLLRFPANDYVGEIVVVGIGLEDHAERILEWEKINRFMADPSWVREILPRRPRDAHKGTFGTAMVVAGSVNYTGAAILAGKAAYRAGAGLVTLAIPRPLHESLAGQFPEATWLLLPHELGVIAASASNLLLENLERVTALLIGPGFGLDPETKEFIDRITGGSQHKKTSGIGFVPSSVKEPLLLKDRNIPLVIDADGLKLLAQLEDWYRRLPENSILTPHPGEMAILTGHSTSEIQSDRVKFAEDFAQKWEHIVVLKGANTVVSAPDGSTVVIPVASPALARAGSGDVLAGLIVGLRAQGVPAFESAIAGCWIHARSGLLAANRLGTAISVLAGDLLDAIPGVFKELRV